MKVEVVEKEVVSELPEVGEAWKHDRCDNIFIRIIDYAGIKILPEFKTENYFFSLDLTDGYIVATPRTSEDIVILKPVGGVMKFERD